MMTHDDEPRLERIPTGIAGLDIILKGGFVRGGIYIVTGCPGSGKTIFGNQLCFSHVAAGGKAAFVTLLSESHARMMLNLSELSFFDATVIPKSLYYLSAFAALESEGLKGLLDLVRREVRGHGATVLVIDGLVAVEESAESDQQFKKFIHELQNQSSLSSCTTFLLTSGGTRSIRPEKTMVDGLIELNDELDSCRRERKFEVTKFRGGSSLRGQHTFEITDDGIVIHPRIETLLARPTIAGVCSPERISTGVPDLDAMLGGGGLPLGSTTMVLGPPGAGKTSLGLHFISKCNEAERGLYFSFYETPERAQEKGDRLGLQIGRALREGHVAYLWNPTTENTLDALGNQLVDVARKMEARRVFIDGLDGFRQTMPDPGRLARFFTAIANEFRVRGRTTLYTAESRSLMGTEIEAPPSGISTVLDNWISVRISEIDSRLRRVVSVLKVRDSAFDATIRELTIADTGITIGGPFAGVDGVLTGVTHRQARRGTGKKGGKRPRRSNRARK